MRRVRYNHGDEIIEIIIKDATNAKIEFYHCNMSDFREFGRILQRLYKKYGIKPMFDKDFLSIDAEFFKF